MPCGNHETAAEPWNVGEGATVRGVALARTRQGSGHAR